MNKKDDNFVKFIYFSHQTLQIPRVAMQCMVALCEAAAQLGADSEIVSFVSEVHSSEPEHPSFEVLYGLETQIKHSSYSLFINRNTYIYNNKLDFLLEIQRLFIYLIHSLRFFLSRQGKRYNYVICSSRNYAILGMLAIVKKILKKKIIVLADVHDMPRSLGQGLVLRIVDGNICISHSLADELKRKFHIPQERVRVAHNGIKINRFMSGSESRKKICRRHNIQTDKKIICYTGKVYYPYQEIDYYLQVAERLNSNSVVVIVGGRPDHVREWKKECKRRKISNVVFQSFVPPSEIPDYQKAADLLVMYYPPIKQIDYTSPTKLFEYLSSGVPVVSCRSRSIEEIITGSENGFLVEPYKPHLLAERINEILADRELLKSIGRKGLERAKEFTWEKRAKCFLNFGKSLAHNSH